MNKKLLKRILLLLLVALLALIWVLSIQKFKKSETEKEKYQSLPDFTFYSLDNEKLQLASLGKAEFTVLIFFDPECDFCALEIKSLEKHIHEFQDCLFTLISSDPIDSIKTYIQKFDFSSVSNVGFYHADREHLIEKFTGFSYPTVFIYNSHNELIERFIGFTKMDEIFEVLHPVAKQ